VSDKLKTVLLVGSAVLAVPVLAALIWGLMWVTADLRGATEAREQTVGSGDFRLAAYEHFFGLCTSVQAQEGRTDALELELEGPVTPARESQVRASLTAVRAQRSELIAEYNQDALAQYTRGQFRDEDLPYQLDNDNEETLCALP
jgi:hypothetical protein